MSRALSLHRGKPCRGHHFRDSRGEIVYVLSSTQGAAYGVTRHDIVARLRPLLSLRGLTIPGKAVILHALDLYEMHAFLDFADALTAASAEQHQLDSITSYDRDFERIEGIRRVEPEDTELPHAA